MLNGVDGCFTVVGAGKSGVAAANALARQGANVHLTEGQPHKTRPDNLDTEVTYTAGSNQVRPGDVAVLSPGITEVSPVRQEIAQSASRSIGEVELFYMLCPAPILAITGTDGKSTVTTMLGDMCGHAQFHTIVGGNLGTPLCSFLDETTPRSLVVAEISAFQLTTCDTFRPRVAVVTNIAEDHIDYHGSFEAYQAAKRRITHRMTPNDVVVLNGDDEEIARWPKPHGPVIRTFSLTGNREADAIYENGKLLLGPEGNRQYLMERDELPLLGAHNVANALAAALAAASYGIALEPIRNALMAYQALPHRLKPVTTCGDVVWINDSKATNPNAASAALKAMTRPTILLVGGSEKEADFGPLGTLIGQTTKTVIAYGSTRHRLAEAIGTDHSVILVETLDEAVARANTLADPGDAVLLSPACASYDQFRSYAHRGDIFERLVLTATKLHENASK